MDRSIGLASTLHVKAILILAIGVVSILRTPADIFPNINIPVVSIIWNYNGLVPKERSDRIISITERNLTPVVDNIERSNPNRCTELQSSKYFCSQMQASTARLRGSQPIHKRGFGSCPRYDATVDHCLQRIARCGDATGSLRAGTLRATA